MEEAVERNKFPLQGFAGFARVRAFLVARGEDQSNLARALSGKIGDVQVVVVVGGGGGWVGGDRISWRKEHRWEPERCEGGAEEDGGGKRCEISPLVAP